MCKYFALDRVRICEGNKWWFTFNLEKRAEKGESTCVCRVIFFWKMSFTLDNGDGPQFFQR